MGPRLGALTDFLHALSMVAWIVGLPNAEPVVDARGTRERAKDAREARAPWLVGERLRARP